MSPFERAHECLLGLKLMEPVQFDPETVKMRSIGDAGHRKLDSALRCTDDQVEFRVRSRTRVLDGIFEGFLDHYAGTFRNTGIREGGPTPNPLCGVIDGSFGRLAGSLAVTFSIRSKLALLAGVPVIGAGILSAQIVTQARAQVRLAEALGSVESLVELSERTTTLIHGLENERTSLCLATGYRVAAGHGESQMNLETTAQQARVIMVRTDTALESLNRFLMVRNESALPKRLSDSLRTAKLQLRGIAKIRAQLDQEPVNWDELTTYYERSIRALTGTVAGLSELSNDGELLRVLNALVVILELEARATAEHALLAHVLAVGEFPCRAGFCRRLSRRFEDGSSRSVASGQSTTLRYHQKSAG